MATYNWDSIKKIHRISIFLIIVNIAFGYFLYTNKNHSTTLYSQTTGRVGYISAKRGVNLRAGPNATSNLVTTIANGEQVTILNDTTSVSKGWVEINYYGNHGWIWGAF